MQVGSRKLLICYTPRCSAFDVFADENKQQLLFDASMEGYSPGFINMRPFANFEPNVDRWKEILNQRGFEHIWFAGSGCCAATRVMVMAGRLLGLDLRVVDPVHRGIEAVVSWSRDTSPLELKLVESQVC